LIRRTRLCDPRYVFGGREPLAGSIGLRHLTARTSAWRANSIGRSFFTVKWLSRLHGRWKVGMVGNVRIRPIPDAAQTSERSTPRRA
jgi:hypothetical protein